MALTRIDYEEIVLIRITELNPLVPHYWSEFTVLAKQLVNQAQEKRLNTMVREVEHMVLEEEFWFNHFRCHDCGHFWKTDSDWYEVEMCPKCRTYNVLLTVERHSLYDIEMAMESNRDYTAYFNRYGAKIYKFDVERKLNKIKEWIFQIVKMQSQNRRFKHFR